MSEPRRTAKLRFAGGYTPVTDDYLTAMTALELIMTRIRTQAADPRPDAWLRRHRERLCREVERLRAEGHVGHMVRLMVDNTRQSRRTEYG